MTVISELCGGLALFLYGMGVMSRSLTSLAGTRLPSVLAAVTKSRLRGFLAGLGVTALVQSSSAVGVMLISLVGSGVLSFSRTFGVIMGSNIGTTVTAWLISLDELPALFSFLKPATFAPIVALVGVLVNMFGKNQKLKNIGSISVGFAILIIGMELMSDAVSFVKQSEGFSSVMVMFKNPIAAVAVSAVFTAIIQSSSASIGILQAFASSGGITFSMALPLVLGANIGTCITGLIAAVGASRDAKRVAVLQTYFNLFGAAAFLVFILFVKLPDVSLGSFHIAAIHTAFNVLTTLLVAPLGGPIIRITEKTVK